MRESDFLTFWKVSVAILHAKSFDDAWFCDVIEFDKIKIVFFKVSIGFLIGE